MGAGAKGDGEGVTAWHSEPEVQVAETDRRSELVPSGLAFSSPSAQRSPPGDVRAHSAVGRPSSQSD